MNVNIFVKKKKKKMKNLKTTVIFCTIKVDHAYEKKDYVVSLYPLILFRERED